MKTAFRKSLLITAVAGVLAAPVAQATNGYFSHGYSTKEKGLAGAGAALSQDAMAAATNPAGMAFVGERMDIGIALFSPSPREYTVTGNPPAPVGTPATAPGFCTGAFPPSGGDTCQFPFSVNPGNVESENDFFLIPHFGINWNLDSQSSVGLSAYGSGGMDTEYKGGSATTMNPSTGQIDSFPGTFGAGTAGVTLAQLFVNASYARKINEESAWGASLIFAFQRFNAQGLSGFAAYSNDPANIGVNQHDYSNGFGFKLGYQGEIVPDLTFGASYQTEISMSEFDIYSGLFAEGGDFDIPSTYTVGLAYDFGDAGTVVFDFQRINYSDIKSINNPISKFFNPQGNCVDPLNANSFGVSPGGPGCLGGSDGAGFGWQDINIFKLGYQMMIGDNTHRFGYSHSDQPIPESETLFNILAPAVIQDHITYGLTMPVGTNQEFNFAAMYALNASVKGANPFDQGSTQIEIEMSQWELQAGWAWKY